MVMFAHLVQFSEHPCSLLTAIFDSLWAEIVNFGRCKTLQEARSSLNAAIQPLSLIMSSTLVYVLMVEHLLQLF